MTPSDLAAFARLGIDAQVLARAQVRRVTDAEAREVLALNGRHGDLSGILFPYIWPGESRPATYRLRRDHPEIEGGRAKNKYVSGYGDRRHLYVVAEPAVVHEPTIPAVLVEAEKSALAVASAAARLHRPVLSIALGGCYGWRARIGKVTTPTGGRADEVGALPDFDRIGWAGREVVIAFDANAATNPAVQHARAALNKTVLHPRGATVRILELPGDSAVNGPDDFIAAHGDVAFFDLLDAATVAGVRLEDFYAYMPAHSYIFVSSGEHWPGGSVNTRLAPIPRLQADGTPMLDTKGQPQVIAPAAWLDKHRPVEQQTWVPGHPQLIRDRLVSDGGWIERPGCAIFNLYRPPTIQPGDAQQAGHWIEHVYRVYPTDAEHIVPWLAHRVQYPAVKINHALVLGGAQGIGKDTLLEPLKHAVGPWNFIEVAPSHLLGRFNGFVRSVILRVSEARDLGDLDRYSFYDHLKAYTAAPPDVLRVDEKHLREYAVWNVCGVILTTNHKTDGLYLPSDDRRHYVAWSDCTKDDFDEDYWRGLWGWYAAGGFRHITAYLAAYDLATFNPKAPPPKTDAFWSIVDSNRAPEDGELADVLDDLKWPKAITIDLVARHATVGFAEWLRDRKSARQVPHRMGAAEYTPIRNPAAKDGLWKIDGRRQVVYVQRQLSLRDRLAAAQELTR